MCNRCCFTVSQPTLYTKPIVRYTLRVMSKRISILLIAAIFLPVILWAAMPDPTGFVTDAAGVMDPGVKSRLESFLSSFEKQTGIEVAVATVPSLDGRPVEDYAVDIFERWGIGKKGKNNGVLFIVAPNERKMRIEVGYGLEGAINDALAGRILDGAVVPKFKEGDISGGIAAGALAIVDTIVAKENLNFDEKMTINEPGPADSRPGEGGGPLSTLGKILILLVLGYVFIRHPWLLLFFLSSGGSRGGSGGGGFSGGFGGFGGGMSGGGGASRGW